MKPVVTPAPRPGADAPRRPVPCRYCGAPDTSVIDRRADRVLRHCSSCKLSWTSDAEAEAEAERPDSSPT